MGFKYRAGESSRFLFVGDWALGDGPLRLGWAVP